MFKNKPLLQLLRAALYLHQKLIYQLLLFYGGLLFIGVHSDYFILGGYNMVLFIGGALLSASAFKEVHAAKTSILYLTLPVSPLSRYLSVWLLTGPIYLLLLTILCIAALLLNPSDNFWAALENGMIATAMGAYSILNAILLFGSVYFKKFPLLKTVMVILLISIGIGALQDTVLEKFLSGSLVTIINGSLWTMVGIIAWCCGYYQLKKTAA